MPSLTLAIVVPSWTCPIFVEWTGNDWLYISWLRFKIYITLSRKKTSGVVVINFTIWSWSLFDLIDSENTIGKTIGHHQGCGKVRVAVKSSPSQAATMTRPPLTLRYISDLIGSYFLSVSETTFCCSYSMYKCKSHSFKFSQWNERVCDAAIVRECMDGGNDVFIHSSHRTWTRNYLWELIECDAINSSWDLWQKQR